MHVHVGTSGYNYPEWRGTFYPEKFSATKMFGYYSERFHTVEINYTFYRMPTEKLIAGWVEQAPPGFLYTLKAPKRITHERRLKDCADATTTFTDVARGLGGALATLLFQLPPNMKCDLGRFDDFLATMPRDLKAAFEFRNDTWLSDAVYQRLHDAGFALCIADFGDKTTPLQTTARYGYFRLRDEGYQPDDLARWADTLAAQAAHWDDAFVYFKHEGEGKGPEFAAAFVELLNARGVTTA
jgi:uncharacterized protein YecE (DUF72 family)